jgi:hypothetical protein
MFASDPASASHYFSMALFNTKMRRQQRAFEQKQKEDSQ